MKAIFLDIDGVLNSNEHTAFIKSFITYGDNMIEPFDDECLHNLKYIVDETDAKIIITSIWRLFPDYLYILMNKLEEYGLDKNVISLTTSNKYKEQIKENKECLQSTEKNLETSKTKSDTLPQPSNPENSSTNSELES